MNAVLLTCCVGVLAGALQAVETPVLYWASDPVRPNETVLVAGGHLSAEAVVELARLEDGDAADGAAAPRVAAWTPVPVLQGSEQALKFVVPAEWKMGVFACRVRVGGAASELRRINAPEVWWLQGDTGESATAGGWVRVFGRCLRGGVPGRVRLQPEQGAARLLACSSGDDFSLQAALPAELPPGSYTVQVHNGYGGAAGWSPAGTLRVEVAVKPPEAVYDVMDFYGKDREKELQRTIRRGSKPVDRTEAILAALKKAQENGGGVVFFPAGIYGIQRELKIPPRTTLKGEGMGLAVLRWGSGTFALDGGGSQQRDEGPLEGEFTGRLLFGDRFALEDLSLYVPLGCNNAIQAGDNFAMRRVRVRVDRYWMRSPQRQDGCFLRVGRNFTIADCDILAKASAVALGSYGVLQRNKIQAGKCNSELGHAAQVIVEDNQMVSLDPTAYINVYEEGRNIYYARNRHESLYAHQSDFSFTFDGIGGAYLGGVAACDATRLTLAADPTYLKWAPEKHALWRKSAVCILAGRGAGQYRFVTANQGREWTLHAPFEVQPDASSIVSIVPYRGNLLVVGNRFEDANWVNLGYGSSLDVVCAANTLVRCGQLLNYGLKLDSGQQPSWRVQYLDNEVLEGHTLIETSSPLKTPAPYEGPITRWCVQRGTRLHSDNSGNIRVGGNAADTVVERCRFEHPAGFIENSKNALGSLFRANVFPAAGPGKAVYKGEGALIVPAPVEQK